jgi:hypothetical protein
LLPDKFCRELNTKESLIAWIGLGVVVYALYHRSFSGWWTFDDPQILKAAFENPPWKYFFVPHVLRSFQPANLNPLILLSFDFDFVFCGLNPKIFYVHQFLLIWGIGGLTYHLLRRLVSFFWAVLGPALFTLSVPVLNCAYQLMTRHYLEGLFFSILAIHVYVFSIKKGRFSWTWMGAFLYFLAASAKEVYVVLPLMLIVMPVTGWKPRMRFLSPFFMVMGFYALWRRLMLGKWVGGYGQALGLSDILEGFERIPSELFYGRFMGVATFCAALFIILYIIRKRRNLSICFWVWGILLLGPILPVINISAPQRLLLFFSWSFFFALSWALGNFKLRNIYLKVGIVGVVFLLGFSVSIRATMLRPELEKACAAYEAHGRFIMEGKRFEVLLPSEVYGNWYAAGLLWLRKNVLHQAPPMVVYDEIDLAGLNDKVTNCYYFDEKKRKVLKASGGISEILSGWKKRVRKETVDVSFSYDSGMLSWIFGPFRSGQYSIITYGESGSRMWLPKQGRLRKDLSEPRVFRIRFDSFEGWIAYSDLLRFDGKKMVSLGESKMGNVR